MWKDPNPARFIIFPSFWNFLLWKQSTLHELVSLRVLGARVNLRGNAHFKKKKSLLVGKSVSLLN